MHPIDLGTEPASDQVKIDFFFPSRSFVAVSFQGSDTLEEAETTLLVLSDPKTAMFAAPPLGGTFCESSEFTVLKLEDQLTDYQVYISTVKEIRFR